MNPEKAAMDDHVHVHGISPDSSTPFSTPTPSGSGSGKSTSASMVLEGVGSSSVSIVVDSVPKSLPTGLSPDYGTPIAIPAPSGSMVPKEDGSSSVSIVVDSISKSLQTGLYLDSGTPASTPEPSGSGSGISTSPSTGLGGGGSPSVSTAVNSVSENLPTGEETRYSRCVSLHKAALKGNWDAARTLFDRDSGVIRAPITETKDTALHIAAIQGHLNFVSKLLEEMEGVDLETKYAKGSTALCFAAAGGHRTIAQLMVGMNANLPKIKDDDGLTPLYRAALQGFDGMVRDLYPLSEFESWGMEDQTALVTTLIDSELYGLALEIVKQYRPLVIAPDCNGETPLQVLARKPLAFCRSPGRGLWFNIFKTILLSCKKLNTQTINEPSDASKLLDHLWDNVIVESSIEMGETRLLPDLAFVAAESGNEDFVVELLQRHPDFAYKVNESNHSIFHIAVLRRYLKVFNLIYELDVVKDLIATYIDEDGNTILHLAAKLAPRNQLNMIPGAALQMQREVLWYKEVEKLVRPSYRSKKNGAGQTPYNLFLEEHDNLIKEGDEAMKKIAKNCMLVTILIATVMFSAAFTVPSGFKTSAVFSISEVVAILFSLTSTLLFLSILTSRCSDDYFLKTLPFYLVTGMATLFISIVGMVTAFCTIPIFFHHGWAAKAILLVLFASVPILFLVMKYSLLVTVLRSTYSSRTLFRSNN